MLQRCLATHLSGFGNGGGCVMADEKSRLHRQFDAIGRMAPVSRRIINPLRSHRRSGAAARPGGCETLGNASLPTPSASKPADLPASH